MQTACKLKGSPFYCNKIRSDHFVYSFFPFLHLFIFPDQSFFFVLDCRHGGGPA